MHDNQGALHVTVRHSMQGRIRLSFERAFPHPELLLTIDGIREMQWNPRLCSMLVKYDTHALTEFEVLQQVCGHYAAQLSPKMIHVRHEEEEGFTLSSTAVMALLSIGLDGMVQSFTLPFATFTKWLSVLTTLTAVTEHGWEELNQRGSFDPEVMSIVYLLNSLSGGKTLQASAIAWGLTFGRHLLPQETRETFWVVTQLSGKVTLTPVARASSKAFAGRLLRTGLDTMARRN